MTEIPPLTPDALSALHVTGVNERWNAVQERLQPFLAALALELEREGARRFAREWPLYEISYKHQRYINRGPGERAPIDEYHMAIDRPPRGAGVYLVIDGTERLIIVALQLWRTRKHNLRQLWDEHGLIWRPLIERMREVRFAERTADAIEPVGDLQTTWLDRYLSNRRAAYLLAGFSYRWDDPRVLQPGFRAHIIDDILALLPLNEAIMERAE